MMHKKITFFNCFHNGDVHVSRGLVRQIMNKVHQGDSSIVFTYGHRNPINLITDIPDLIHDPGSMRFVASEHHNLFMGGDAIFVNTWYAQQHHKYMNRYGITFDSLYTGLDDTCKSLWGFSLSEITTDLTKFFPIIDYTKYEIEAIKAWLQIHPESKIIVENGSANSGQATNFMMTPIIRNLANKYPHKTFILTNQDGTPNLPSNVFQSSDIIRKTIRSDLNEISFLSTHCDMVIGRTSGVWSFTLTQENLFQRKMKYLGFANSLPAKPNKFWLGPLFQDQINYSSEFIMSEEENVDRVQSIIETHL